MRRILLATLLSVGLASPALASQCPKDMAEIDAALEQNPDLTAEQLDEVKELRAEGEELHQNGKHQDSVDTLMQAKQILGIE